MRDEGKDKLKEPKNSQKKQHNVHPGVPQDHLGGLAVLPGIASLGGSHRADDQGKCQCQKRSDSDGRHGDKLNSAWLL